MLNTIGVYSYGVYLFFVIQSYRLLTEVCVISANTYWCIDITLLGSLSDPTIGIRACEPLRGSGVISRKQSTKKNGYHLFTLCFSLVSNIFVKCVTVQEEGDIGCV